jgi:hypothetical protein
LVLPILPMRSNSMWDTLESNGRSDRAAAIARKKCYDEKERPWPIL